MIRRLRGACAAFRQGVALIAAAMLLAACSDNPLGAGRITNITEAEARWRQAALTSYRFISEVSCFCASVGRVDVTVVDGAVVQVVRLIDGSEEPPIYRLSIDSLFAFVKRQQRDDPSHLRVTWDQTLGYPRTVDWGTPENDAGGFFGVSSVRRRP